MRITPLLALLSLAVLQSELPAQAGATRPTPEQEQAIRAVYQQLLDADAANDTSALSRILAPGYTFVPPRGDTILTREERIANTAADTSGVQGHYTLQHCRTQIHGGTAVAHCRYTAVFRSPGATADSSREMISTAVFAKQGKHWRLVATHPAPVRRLAIADTSGAR